MWKLTSFSMFVTVLLMLTFQRVVSDTIIDLSHPLSPSTLYWPGVPSFQRNIIMNQTNEHNIWIEVGVFTSGEHGGTHIDAPRHFYKTGYDLKDLPLENTIAEGITIDTSAEARANSDYALTVDKIQEWEKEHGRIPDKAAIIVRTGWSKRWSDPSSFFNTNTPDDFTTFHFPIVSVEAARWLLQNRSMKMLGLDVPAPDGPRDSTYPVHVTLLSRNVIILENMMIPDSLPARGFRVHASPLRIEGGTGAQTRIYAMILEDGGNNGFSLCQQCHWFSLFLLAIISLFMGWR